MTINRETAQLLERVAAVFRVKEGDTFRVKAYNNAAAVIENLGEPIDNLWKENRLDSVPGLGEGIQKYLSEYFTKGRVRHFDSQFKKVPAGMFSLMSIRGIGPITAYKIAKKFKLTDEKTAIKKLSLLIKQKKLKNLEDFKDKSVLRLTKSLKINSTGKGRILLSEAFKIAEEYINYLKKSPHSIEAEPLGSLRRKLATVGDIDLAVNSNNPSKTMEHVLSYPNISSVITSGEKVSHVKLKNGFEVDIKISEPMGWGSLLQHYTGSKMHNIHLRTIAKDKGLSLSEYGVKKGKKLLRFNTEIDFYRYLGMQMIPPEIREDGGEIELAQRNMLPTLVEQKDIKGDLHIHSDFDYPSSHDLGESTLHEILRQAQKQKYQYVGIADHNPKITGLSEKETKRILIERKKYLEKNFRTYEKSVKTRTLKLLIGMEVDIRPDGDLALSDKLIDTFDYIIVSIHSSFEKSKEDNTERILNALSHPKAIILGHPTGRIINSREPIPADWPKIFDYCAKNGKMLEINAYPDRLDPQEDLIKLAINQGVRLIINTDSHHVGHMELMKFGVWQAKRGFAGKQDIVNTRPLQDFLRVLK